jgi:hypothetical protein
VVRTAHNLHLLENVGALWVGTRPRRKTKDAETSRERKKMVEGATEREREGRSEEQREESEGGQNVCGSELETTQGERDQKGGQRRASKEKEEGGLASVTLGLFLKFGFRCLSPFYSRETVGGQGTVRKAEERRIKGEGKGSERGLSASWAEPWSASLR